MALYREGKAAMAADGTVTGTGTKWQSSLSLIRPGATIMFLSSPIQMAVVNKVVSDTEIKAITTNGAVVASTDYAILLSDSLTVDGLAQDVAETLRYYQSQETVIADAVEFFKNFDFDSLQNLANQIKADSESAEASATAAAASESSAKTSETNAKASENAAKISEVAAETARDQTQQIINDAGEQSTLVVLAQPSGASKIGLPDGGTLDYAIKWVTPEMFGAVGDGVADDSDALQAAMNACVDFVWQGNVSDTDSRGATVKYYLMLPGRYRFTRTMIIPPYLRMSGIAQSYLGDPSNNFTKFIPDFSMQDGYAFESLNFDKTGTHTAKVDSYSASASDRREVTRCPGLLLENFSVVAGANTSLKGIFNFRLTHGGVLKSICARITTKAAVGANLTCTWNGAFRDCIFRTAVLGLTLRNNVTTWLFDNCYFQTTQGPNPLPWFTDFPEFYGYTTRRAWTACVAGSWSSPHFKDCTLENSQNGYRLHRCQGGSEHGTYFENIEEECYALMECVMSMTPGYFYSNKGAAATTRMVFLSGSPANSASIDMTNTNYFSQTVDPYDCPGASKLVVKHAGDMRTRMKIAYPSKVIFNCYSQFSGYCDIYVSESGDDSYNGYSSSYPVKTLQEALLRCQPSYKNRIYISAGNTVTTTTYYSDGFEPNRRFFENFDIQVIGDATTKPTLVIGENPGWLSGVGVKDGRISFKNLNVTLTLSSSTSAAAIAFGALVYVYGDCGVSFDNCTISGSDVTYKPCLVSPAQRAGVVKLSLNSCSLSNMNIIQGSNISGLGLAYILNHYNCTFSSVTEGSTTAKIYSRAIA